MLKKYFKDILPKRDALLQQRWFRPVAHRLQHPSLWHLHRRSVAGGVAVGLFCGLIPGPLQMLGAALLAVLLRINLPVALFVTLYSNPFTILPLYLLAYELGRWVLGGDGVYPAAIAWPDMNWNDWFMPLLHWIYALGKPFAIGLPLLAGLLALLGYFSVRLIWRISVLWNLHKRRVQRRRR